jgi:hypothetical protein
MKIPPNFKLVGFTSVDSGTIMIVDPCYVLPYDDDVPSFVYQDTWPATLSPSGAGSFGAVFNGLGFATATYYGDGSYPIYADIDPQSLRVRQIIIDFYGSDDDDDEIEVPLVTYESLPKPCDRCGELVIPEEGKRQHSSHGHPLHSECCPWCKDDCGNPNLCCDHEIKYPADHDDHPFYKHMRFFEWLDMKISFVEFYEQQGLDDTEIVSELKHIISSGPPIAIRHVSPVLKNLWTKYPELKQHFKLLPMW